MDSNLSPCSNLLHLNDEIFHFCPLLLLSRRSDRFPMSANPYRPPTTVHESEAPEQVRLDYSWRLKLTFIIVALVSVGLVVMSLPAAIDGDPLALIEMGVLSIVFGAPLTSLLVEYFGVVIVADETGIRTTSPWRNPRSIPWDDLERVDYSVLLQWHRIHTRSHGIVRCSTQISNVAPLLEMIAARGIPVESRRK